MLRRVACQASIHQKNTPFIGQDISLAQQPLCKLLAFARGCLRYASRMLGAGAPWMRPLNLQVYAAYRAEPGEPGWGQHKPIRCRGFTR